MVNLIQNPSENDLNTFIQILNWYNVFYLTLH